MAEKQIIMELVAFGFIWFGKLAHLYSHTHSSRQVPSHPQLPSFLHPICSPFPLSHLPLPLTLLSTPVKTPPGSCFILLPTICSKIYFPYHQRASLPRPHQPPLEVPLGSPVHPPRVPSPHLGCLFAFTSYRSNPIPLGTIWPRVEAGCIRWEAVSTGTLGNESPPAAAGTCCSVPLRSWVHPGYS